MRLHHCLAATILLLSAASLAAQEPPPDSTAAAARDTTATGADSTGGASPDSAALQRGLRLGLKPMPRPFDIRFPAAPGLDAVWLRPRFTDWAGEWAAKTRSRIEAESRRFRWMDPALAVKAAEPDSVPYLPPPPVRRDSARSPSILPGAVSEHADLGMVVNGRAELGGSWVRTEPCIPGFQFTCNPSLIPQLKPDIQFGVRVAGTISERVHVNVDYDQRREFDAANNINVYYQGLEDEILQRLEVGDVSIRLPPSRFITQGIPAGNFGFRAEGQLGPLDFQAVWAQQKGDVSQREFQLGGTGSQAGLVQDLEVVLDDADYVQGQFFFIVDPDSLVGAPHVDVLGLRPSDASPSVRPQAGTLLVYRDERASQLNPQQSAQLGYFQARALAARDTTIQHAGMFRRLTLGEDYIVHSSGLWIMLRVPLRPDEALAVVYTTESGTQVGTPNPEQAPAGTTPRLRLIRGPEAIHQPGQPTWDYEMHQVYRLDSSSGVELGSVQLSISLGELVGGVTYRDFNGQQVTFLKLFGMDEDAPTDQVDAAQVYQPGRDPFGGTPAEGGIGGTFIVFPTLRPFAAPPPVPSLGLSAEDALAILGADSNAVIYEDPDPVARESGTRFRLNLKYRVRLEGLISQFNLGAFGIREGSEQILVDGVPLVRGQDYTIDYDIGQVVLLNPQAIFGTNPNAQIRATYEQKSLFQIAPTSVFGMSTRYRLGTRGELNLTGLYQSEKSLVSRPQLGLEPGAIFLGGASGKLDLGGGWLDRALGAVPGLRVSGTSSVNVSGEVAMSLPNPNTQGDTYVDDFEATDEIPILLSPHVWRLGSRPQDPAGAEMYLPLPLDVPTAGRLVWQDLLEDATGRIFGPLSPAAIDQQIKIAGGVINETVMWLTFGDTLVPPGQRLWRSLTTVLSTTGRDLTRSEYLEFYIAPPPGTDHALIFDLGEVGEDAFYFDATGATTGTYEDGRPWGLGVLDEEARVVDQEIWSNQEHDARGLWDQPCQATANRSAYPPGDERANCARGNGRVDTEDLNGNGVGDFNDGAYFRYVVPLDGTSPYLVRDTMGTGTAFFLYRIPLRAADRIAVGGASEGTLRFIKHLRVTITGSPGTLVLARMRIVGSRWVKRNTHGILAGRIGAEPGQGSAVTRFEVGPVSRLTDGDAYQPPPGVRDQVQDPSQNFSIGGAVFNEKGMRLSYTDLGPDERAEIYFRYAQQPRNLLSYRQLRLWAVARAGQWGPQGTERLLVKLGTDANNYYLFQTPLNPSLGGGNVSTDDWRPEIVIDFERWIALRSQAEQQLITAPPPAGEPLVLWSEDSTYAVVLEERGRAPNLAAVREIVFAVYNGGTLPATGEVWVNELRLSGAVRDPGYAGQLNLDVRAGDFLNTNVAFASQGALYRQLNQDASYQRSADLSVNSTAQLGNLLPSAWGMNLPVSFSHARTMTDPTFLDRTDVRTDQLVGLRPTGSTRTRVGVALSKRTPTANPFLSLLVDGVSLRFGYNTANSGTVTSESDSRSVDGGLTYSRQLSAREFDVVPGVIEGVLRALLPRKVEQSEFFQRLTGARLRWNPASISFSTGYFDQVGQTFRYDRILESDEDTLVVPVESRRRGLDNNARIAFQPFESLTADLSVSSARDLLPAANATPRENEQEAIQRARSTFAGMDIGWETNRTMATQVSFRPRIASWLSPGITVSTRFSTSRNPSYIEAIELDGDSAYVLQRNFQADRQISRTLQLETAGLMHALLGPAPSRGFSLKRLLLGAGRMLQPIDLSWNTALNSHFEREVSEPPLEYQFGWGDLDAFRFMGGDTAIAARETEAFRARTGLAISQMLRLDVSYGDSRAYAPSLRAGDQRRYERTWPELRLSWSEVPLPAPARAFLTRLSLTGGIAVRESEDAFGSGDAVQLRSSESRSIPITASFVLGSGWSAGYSGSLSSGVSRDATGRTEESGASHQFSLTARIDPPDGMRQRLRQPIQASLRYSYQARQQCRVRSTTAGETATCTPYVDVLNRSFNLNLDTMLSQLDVGLQVSYTDTKSFVGQRGGTSQFQLGFYGQFYFATGDLPGTR